MHKRQGQQAWCPFPATVQPFIVPVSTSSLSNANQHGRLVAHMWKGRQRARICRARKYKKNYLKWCKLCLNCVYSINQRLWRFWPAGKPWLHSTTPLVWVCVSFSTHSGWWFRMPAGHTSSCKTWRDAVCSRYEKLNHARVTRNNVERRWHTVQGKGWKCTPFPPLSVLLPFFLSSLRIQGRCGNVSIDTVTLATGFG